MFIACWVNKAKRAPEGSPPPQKQQQAANVAQANSIRPLPTSSTLLGMENKNEGEQEGGTIAAGAAAGAESAAVSAAAPPVLGSRILATISFDATTLRRIRAQPLQHYNTDVVAAADASPPSEVTAEHEAVACSLPIGVC